MCNKTLSITCSFALVKWCVAQHWTLINSEIEGYDGTHFTFNQVFVFIPDGVLVWFQIGWEGQIGVGTPNSYIILLEHTI